MKIEPQPSLPLQRGVSEEEFRRSLDRELRQIRQVLAGRVGLDTMEGALITIPDTGAANTEFAVTHGLGRIPLIYIADLDQSGSVYQLADTGTAWTETTMYLKCTAANAKLTLFVL